MPPLDLPVDKGENTVMDSKRLPPGFLELLDGWVYMPDDPDQLHKIPGRSEAATMPAGVTADNVKGLVHLQFNNAANKVVLLGNSKLYEADDGDTLGAWAEVQDGNGAAFSMEGDYLRAVADGANRWVLWSGTNAGDDERALIRDEDGGWRRLGMQAAGTATLSVTPPTGGSPPEIVQPDTFELAPAGFYTMNDNPNGGGSGRESAARWNDEAFAVDDGTDDKYETVAFTTSLPNGTTGRRKRLVGTRFGFSAQPGDDSDALGYQVFITFDVFGGSQGDPQPLPVNSDGDTRFRGWFIAELYDEAVSTTVPIHKIILDQHYIRTSRSDTNNGVAVSFRIAGSAGQRVWTDLKLDCKWYFRKGTPTITAVVRDIRYARDGVLVLGQVSAGTYEYTTTEVHRVELSSGESFYTESPPAGRLKVTVSGTEADSISLTFSTTRSNIEAEGYKVADMYRNIYRSTKSGTWPDLGLIATVPIEDLTFLDAFLVGASTLGVPALKMVSVGGAFAPQAGVPPTIYDATLLKSALVIIPIDSRRSLMWTLANQPDALPQFHDLRSLPSERNDDIMGVTNLSDTLLVFLRTKVLRVRFLPSSATTVGFDLGSLEVDVLSPDEGLAGGPRAYTTFKTELGHGLVAWTSDNGVWMTDGSLPQERGLGVRKLSRNMAWRKIVDVSALATAVMSYDPVLQIVYLDCDGRDGNRLTLLFHTSPAHWVGDGDAVVPKTARTTVLVAKDRAIGENTSELKHWSLYVGGAAPKVLLERSGVDNDGAAIDSLGKLGWRYPAGPLNGCMVWEGLLAHQDWGLRDMLELRVVTRRDESGVEQERVVVLPLRGNRTDKWLVSLSGQAVRMEFRHTGKTLSDGTGLRAFGPLALQFDAEGDIQDD